MWVGILIYCSVSLIYLFITLDTRANEYPRVEPDIPEWLLIARCLFWPVDLVWRALKWGMQKTEDD